MIKNLKLYLVIRPNIKPNYNYTFAMNEEDATIK